MNSDILQKAVDELKKEDPKIEYVLGMLETLIALSDKKPATTVTGDGRVTVPFVPPTVATNNSHVDEETSVPVPDFAKPGPIGKLTS